MKRKIYFILFVICMLPMMVFASGYVEGNSAATYFSTLTDIIYENSSILGVSSGPEVVNIFEVEEDTKITGIWTYHWLVEDYEGATIKLVNVETNDVYGPWNVVFDKGYLDTPNVNWYVFPNVVIPAGRYKIVDSHNDTWSYAGDTDGKGITIVTGAKNVGNINIDGSTLKPIVNGTPNSLVGFETEKYKISYQSLTEVAKTGSVSKFNEGKDYHYQLGIEPKPGYYFDEDDKVVVDGVIWRWPATYYVNDEPYGALRYSGIAGAYSNQYTFLEGANLKTSNINEFTFRIDADFSKFSDGGEVYVDISKVPSIMYTATNGSTIITLDPEYVKLIPTDEIKLLKVVFNDGGVAITNFTRLSNSVPEDENPSDDDTLEPVDNPTVPTEEEIPTTQVVNNPQTSDNIILYIVIGLISVICFTGATIYIKKRFN